MNINNEILKRIERALKRRERPREDPDSHRERWMLAGFKPGDVDDTWVHEDGRRVTYMIVLTRMPEDIYPSKAAIPLTFKIYRGSEPAREETLIQDIIKIGKLESADLQIDDEKVSRMHAVVEVTGPGEIHVIDLGSSSGTVVNGQKVNKCALQNGDELHLGDTRIVVFIGAAA